MISALHVTSHSSKKVLVQSLEIHDAISANIDAVSNHQFRQFQAINEDHPLAQMLDAVTRWLTES